MLTKNQPGPYPAYFERYLSQLPETDIFTLLEEQPRELQSLLQNLTEAAAEKGYAPGKWSVKEVVGHLTDTERVFLYRCLCISRGETQPLPGFDENLYVQNAHFNQRTLADLFGDYKRQREVTLAFFKTLTPEMLNRVGTANENPFSAKALVIVTAAHELHHLKILKERYVPVINQA
jgi:uncharacterized damage-inducible protein DinB